MKVIGITGGVGSGKTKLLGYLQAHYSCRVLLADEAARQLQEPGGACHRQIVTLLGKEILDPDGALNTQVMAEKIFQDNALLAAVNAVVHPAVRTYILEQIEEERQRGNIAFFFLEAALLIECGYDAVVDELWYVHADREVRRQRLRMGRGYSDEKTDRILAAQLSEEAYREHCSFVIDNSREITYAYGQIDKKMGEYLWES